MKTISSLRRTAASLMTGGLTQTISEEVLNALTSDANTVKHERLEHVLTHAANSVPFYRHFRTDSIETYPVVDKAAIIANRQKFISSVHPPHQQRRVRTSGSTGIPFEALWDRGKVRHHQGALVAAFEYQGLDPFGARIMSKPWPPGKRAQFIGALIRGELRHSGGSKMRPGPEAIKKWMAANRGSSIIGYSSYVEELLLQLGRSGITLSPELIPAVVGTSEPPSVQLPDLVHKAIGKPLKMRYSNMENGVIGLTADDPLEYHIDNESFFVEILREDSDEPVAKGEIGRIVVTDLHNLAMPFIRYDTGDSGRWAVTSDGQVRKNVLTELQGRRLDSIVLDEGPPRRTAHAMQVWAATTALRPARQFQLRQHGVGDFTWVLNADRSLDLESDLRAVLEERVGNIKRCAFVYVGEVPVLSSGKRQIFVNEMY